MRDPENIGKGHPALRRGIQRIPASLLVRFFFLDPASLCGVTRFSTRHPGYTRGLYPKKTVSSTVRASRDARTVRPESPLFFSRKRKGKAKRKLPADVRKLKNDCEARGKRTRRARFAAAVRQALLPRALRLIRPGSNIFFPRSSLSVIFLSAFSHRPDWATRFSHRPRHGHLVIPHSDAGFRNIGKGHPALRRGIQRIPASLLVRFFFLDPASLCGVTRFSTRHPGYTRCLYPKKTAGSTVRATGEHGPCIQNLPFLFPQKKRESQKKAPG